MGKGVSDRLHGRTEKNKMLSISILALLTQNRNLTGNAHTRQEIISLKAPWGPERLSLRDTSFAVGHEPRAGDTCHVIKVKI